MKRKSRQQVLTFRRQGSNSQSVHSLETAVSVSELFSIDEEILSLRSCLFAPDIGALFLTMQ